MYYIIIITIITIIISVIITFITTIIIITIIIITITIITIIITRLDWREEGFCTILLLLLVVVVGAEVAVVVVWRMEDKIQLREAAVCTILLLFLSCMARCEMTRFSWEKQLSVLYYYCSCLAWLDAKWQDSAVCTDLLKTCVFLEWHDDLVCVVSFQPQGSHVDLVVRGDGLQGKPLLHALPRPQVKGHVSWSQTETLYLFNEELNIYLLMVTTDPGSQRETLYLFI